MTRTSRIWCLSSVPARLTVQAGDGQQAEPGTAVTIKPRAGVKDAAGLGVVGVVVNFSVDSGGGTIDASTATTTADGTAGPGNWKLGAAEGRNVLRASVPSVTTLAAAKIGATAAYASIQAGSATIPATGGSLVINKPGSPVNGLVLTVPAGTTTNHWSWHFTATLQP